MLKSLDAFDTESIAAIWNAACGPELAITPRQVAFAARPATGAWQAGQVALADGQPVGFVSATMLTDDPLVSLREVGWIDALAVLPAYQHQGVGRQLLEWAEGWLVQQGCHIARLGGGLHHTTAGLPVELGTQAFFEKHGYAGRPGSDRAWDVSHDLGKYQIPNSKYQIAGIQVRPAQPGDADAILAFLRREFPGRWRFEFEEYARDGGRSSDYVILRTERGVVGCTRVAFEDSAWPLDHYFPHRLPHPWGQLGAIGVSADCRGKGYGGALLDGGLRHLRDNGVRGCVIDWTALLDFYGKFGFQPYREYAMLFKELTKDV